MASTIDIHPVRFNHLVDCSVRDGWYRQLVVEGDITQFQMQLDICPPDFNLVSNPAFDFGTMGWVTSGSAAIANPSGLVKSPGGIGSAVQLLPMPDDILLVFTIEVVIIQGELVISDLGDPITITRSGTYTFFTTTDSQLGITLSGDDISAWEVTSFELFAINTNFAVQVWRAGGTGGDTLVRTIDYEDFPAYFDFTRQWFTFSYDWRDEAGDFIGDGCFYFKVSDPCVCANGGFLAENLWLPNQWQYYSSGEWQIFNGEAEYQASDSSGYALVENVVCDEVEYEVTYTLTNITGTGLQFQAFLGSAGGGLKNTDGTYTDTITANTTPGNYFRLVGYGIAVSGFQVTDLKLRPTNRSYQVQSNLFDVRTTHDCNHLVRACCDTDNMQSGYGDTGFAPRVRIESFYGHGGQVGEASDYRQSTGKKETFFYRGDNTTVFRYSSAKYMHDFIGHLKGYDHVFIDEEEVFIEDEEPTSISWIDRVDMGERIINVSPKQQLIQKTRLSDIINNCSADFGTGTPIGIDGGGIIPNPGGGSPGIEPESSTEGEVLLSSG